MIIWWEQLSIGQNAHTVAIHDNVLTSAGQNVHK